MRFLHVLYDPDCELCRRCRDWLAAQPKYLGMGFLAQGSDEAAAKFPALAPGPGEQVRDLIVVADTGEVYRNTDAWIMCFYALREYRPLSLRLAHPMLRPLARRAYEMVSRNRRWVSTWFTPRRRVSTDALAEQIRSHTSPRVKCERSTCRANGDAW